MMVYPLIALAIMCCAWFLVFHCEYEDGVIGRVALAGLAVTEMLIVMEWLIEDSVPEPLATTFYVQLFFALFLMRHVYRFLRWRTRGDHEWRKAVK